MKKFNMQWIILFASFFLSNTVLAYPLPVTRYGDEGSLYIESSSIVRMNSFIRMTYVINFWQPQSFGSHTYLSKATTVRVDCKNRRVFALSNSFYSQQNMGGDFLGKFPQDDIDGQYAEPGSWVANMVKVGCSFG